MSKIQGAEIIRSNGQPNWNPDTDTIKYYQSLDIINSKKWYWVNGSWVSQDLNTINTDLFEYINENGYNTLRSVSNYDANMLYGSPTVILDNTTAEMRNDNNRFFYWDKLRSHFTAGRYNNLNDIIPQWLSNKLAQYTAVFGWGNFAYGGKIFVNGSQNKGQFISGYENRGGAAYAQTQGAFNANFGKGGVINGTENYLGSTLYEFIYDKPTKTFTINGDKTVYFNIGDLLGIRVLHALNNYYTVATGVITNVSISGSNTIIITELENWIDQPFTTGELWNAENSNDCRDTHVSGHRNVLQNIQYSSIIGNNNKAKDLTNVRIYGDNIIAFNSHMKYESGNDFTIISYNPSILDLGSSKRLHISNNVFVNIPDNVLWQVGLKGVFKNETLNTYHEVNGSALISKDTSATVLTQSTTVSGGGTYNFNFAIYQSGNSLVIEFPNSDILKGAFEVVIKQINL